MKICYVVEWMVWRYFLHPFATIVFVLKIVRNIFALIKLKYEKKKKKYKSNLLRTTRFLNNLHQVRNNLHQVSSFSIIGKLPLDVEKSIFSYQSSICLFPLFTNISILRRQQICDI